MSGRAPTSPAGLLRSGPRVEDLRRPTRAKGQDKDKVRHGRFPAGMPPLCRGLDRPSSGEDNSGTGHHRTWAPLSHRWIIQTRAVIAEEFQKFLMTGVALSRLQARDVVAVEKTHWPRRRLSIKTRQNRMRSGLPFEVTGYRHCLQHRSTRGRRSGKPTPDRKTHMRP